MSIRNKKPVYGLKFEQCIARKAYIYHLYDVLEPLVGSIPSVRLLKLQVNLKKENPFDLELIV